MLYCVYAYLLIFFISLVINSILWIRAKANSLLLIYEIVGASYLIALTLIYFTPGWADGINIWYCLPVIPFIIADIYLSVWGKPEWICPPTVVKHTEDELELARVAAVIFAAPAYISGVLLLIQVSLAKF
jgi:hypothetical protein